MAKIVKFRFQMQTDLLYHIEMFYLNTIEQLFLFVEQQDQLEVCLPYSRLLAGISILAVFQNLRWNSNKTSLLYNIIYWTRIQDWCIEEEGRQGVFVICIRVSFLPDNYKIQMTKIVRTMLMVYKADVAKWWQKLNSYLQSFSILCSHWIKG